MTQAQNVMAAVVNNATVAAKGKVANYSPEATVAILKQWSESAKDRATVQAIANAYGKTVKSVVAKLVKEKVYVKAVAVSKVTGEKPVTKEQQVAQIADLMNVSVEKLIGLEKANKLTLALIHDTLIELGKGFDEPEAETEAEAE